ncbi:hemerythrin domain-containing protein [Legionella septentrionalis]|uniref:Hemerythrin domain-containing protein n=1 Tax=Legionella septentrionalis TaxID=2498109 RepID=A0A433JI97_9GAMM|nr:hemerythrin domain-containing protein [Legionella septentrionalis]RUQ84979.1 hemerythrin domain-containing protein [Legionella septentrionalis]RUR02386.1 hemerythrin domain-containing protein [Legionella septentrionalis]
MDIYDYLKKDHRKVSDLFKQFADAKTHERKKEIIDFLAQELLVHARSEQDTFYKLLESFNESKEEVLHGRKEHQDIEKQLKEVMNSMDSMADLEKKVQKLKEIVEHHVDEEESEIFDQAKDVLSEEDAYMIKEQMHDRKVQYYQNINI